MDTNSRKRYFKRLLVRNRKRPPKRLKRMLYPERIEQRYSNMLIELVAFTRARIEARIVPLLPKLAEYMGRERADAADFGTLADELEKVRIEVFEHYTPAEIQRLASITGQDVEEWNRRQLEGSIGAISEIDLFAHDLSLAREMGAFVHQNVSLIESIPEEYLGQVEKLVATNVRSGTRVEEIQSAILDRYDVAKSRAELIARDQVGKFNGQLTEVRQKNLGIEKYRWRTTGDARVRDTHRANEKRDNGMGPGVFMWSDPPSTGHPGDDYQCRCWAEPVLDDFFPEG